MASTSAAISNGTDPVPAPVDALLLCQRLRQLIEAHYRAGPERYSSERDAEYRRLLHHLRNLLTQSPALRTLKREAYVFPVALAYLCSQDSKWRWEWTVRSQLVLFESRILTLVERLGLDPFPAVLTTPSSAPAPESAAPSPQPSMMIKLTRAQQRAKRRQERAHELQAEGRTIKEIARELDCSPRTVSTYLQRVLVASSGNGTTTS